MSYHEIDRLLYLDTLTRLLEDGSITWDDAGAQYKEDWGKWNSEKLKGEK